MKKVKLLLILLFVILVSIIFTNQIYAVNAMNLNIIDKRPYTSSSYTVTTPNGSIHSIFKIIKNDGVSYVHEDALYCARSGLGFGNSALIEDVNELKDITYTEKYNLKTEVTSVINYYLNTIGYNITNIEYNSMLWIIDNMYLPEHTDATYMKERLMEKAEIINSELTDDDIEFIQQMALWYFTNYDENGGQNSLSLVDTYVLSNTTQINGASLSEVKARQIDQLYRYFIDNAKMNTTNYGIGDTREIPLVKPEIKINNSSKSTTSDQGFVVVGPFNITEEPGTVGYELLLELKDNNGKIIPLMQDGTPIVYIVENPTDMIPSMETLEDSVGQGEFYIKISELWATEFDLTDIDIEANITYENMYKTIATLWLAKADEQPVIKIDREKILEGKFNLNINKVDEEGNLLPGAEFTLITDNRTIIRIINNEDGTFTTENVQITEEGQEFIFEVEEIIVPGGYVGITGPFTIKATTKINAEGTAYILDKVKIINDLGQEIPAIEGITLEIIENTIAITVENRKVREFDLALRKFVTKVNGKDIKERIPKIDTSKLNKIDGTTGKTTTATYTHSKDPVVVKKGDLVTFTIRVYNEGELNGYATKVADYIPKGLGYLMDYKTNTDNFWVPVIDDTTETIDLVGEEGLYASEDIISNLQVEDFYSKDSLEEVNILIGEAKISSTALEDEEIKAYNPEMIAEDVEDIDEWQQSIEGKDGLYYKDVEVTCIVLEENTFKGTLKNIAEVEENKIIDEDGNKVTIGDRDSTPNSLDNVDLDNYNPPVDNSTYQQDDDDYEPLELKCFDLALRKFITGVNYEEVTTRIPEITLNEQGKIEYVHEKTPVYVANSDIVTYTLRVYNEGTISGYAMEISDDIPDGLIFLPEYQTNKEYKWKMYNEDGEETEDVLEAVEIRTSYLENTMLNPYDSTHEISDTNPHYAEAKVAFQVIEENITSEDRIIINKAQITEDKAVDEDGNEIDVEDEDSIPAEWNEGEDDQDIEKIYVKKFDLALLKWVTKTIVKVEDKTTVTDTGFTPYDEPEPIAKIVIDKKKLNKTTVKFVYNIIIVNQGEVEGYATEITDYIPEGLEFVQDDNPIWTREGENKITTRALENTLLKPGETAIIEVVFTWKKDENNLGLKTNIAEISEDYNDYGSEDIDSTPDNVGPKDYDEQQEDDDDKALVILELKTGGATSYIWLGLVVLLIISSGIALIKKYVLI